MPAATEPAFDQPCIAWRGCESIPILRQVGAGGHCPFNVSLSLTGQQVRRMGEELRPVTVATPPINPMEPRLEPHPGGIWSRSHRWLTIGLVLTVAGAAFEAISVATTMPATARDLGGLALYGWAFSAFMLTNLVGITLAGAEADRGGPARPYAVGVVLFALGLMIAGLAPTMVVVIAGRAVQGLGAGFISSVAYVAVGRGYPPEAKARMLAILSSAWVIPGLVGPAVAGLIATHLGWRW